MKSKIFALTTVYGGLDLLPHFLEHYTKLGVDEILVAVGIRTGNQPEENITSKVFKICRDYPTRMFPFSYDKYSCQNNLEWRKNMKVEAGVKPDDWCLHADLDEFYTFPAALSDVIREMEAANDWAVRGFILDRVARDGSLPPIEKETSIWDQFPIGCHITGPFLHANTQKIMLCRGKVWVNGPHDDTKGAYNTRIPVGDAKDYIAHHFRWNANLLKQIDSRLEENNVGPKYNSELKAFRTHWNEYHRLPIDLPKVKAKEVGSFFYQKKNVDVRPVTSQRIAIVSPALGIEKEKVDLFRAKAIAAGVPDEDIFIDDNPLIGTLNLSRVRNRLIRRAMQNNQYDTVAVVDVDCVFSSETLHCTHASISSGNDVVNIAPFDIDSIDSKWAGQRRLTGYGGYMAMTPESWRTVGGYDERFYGWGGEDDEMWRRISEVGLSKSRLALPLAHVKHEQRPALGREFTETNRKLLNGKLSVVLNRRNHLAPVRKNWKHLYFGPTSACGRSCQNCSNKLSNVFLKNHACSLEGLKDILTLYKQASGPICVVISGGGEPALWPHLEDGIRMIKEAGHSVKVMTGDPDRISDRAIEMIDSMRVSRYHKQKIRRDYQKLMGRRYQLHDMRQQTRVPSQPITGEFITSCVCHDTFVYGGWVMPCGDAMDIMLRKGVKLEEARGYIEPLGNYFWDICSFFPYGSIRDVCGMCIGNRSVKREMGTELNCS